MQVMGSVAVHLNLLQVNFEAITHTMERGTMKRMRNSEAEP